MNKKRHFLFEKDSNTCDILFSAFLQQSNGKPAISQNLDKNMKSFTKNRAFWLSIVLTFLFASTAISGFGQTTVKPYLPPIDINKNEPQTVPPPLLVQKTGSVNAVGSPNAAAGSKKTSFPMLADVDIPGYSGVLIETLDGKVVLENYSEETFNPASNVKVATAYAVFKTLGPNYRFQTNVWTDGQIDKESGTLFGNLYVSGRDPVFNLEHAVAVADALNNLGVRKVTGNLIVTEDFIMNFSNSSQSSAYALAATLDSTKRKSSATRAWQEYLKNSGKLGQVNSFPGVSIDGGSSVQTIPTNARILFTEESAPLRAIIKTMMCYSNNFMAHRLGDMLGGPFAVARIVQLNANIAPEEFYIETTSGLGKNRVTPRAQMKLLRTFRKELAKYKMNFTDVMPVAGIDKGTLSRRYDSPFAVGSVVGKTGTLGATDGGVSTLSGEIQTRRGTLLFVIFNMKGSVGRFRSFQNSFVPLVQAQLGGAMPMTYNAVPIDTRLAAFQIKYADEFKEKITRTRVVNEN